MFYMLVFTIFSSIFFILCFQGRMAARSKSKSSHPAKDADIIPVTSRVDQLIRAGEQAGVTQEVLVLSGYILGDRHVIYGDKRRAASNTSLQPLIDSEGSLATVLNIYKAYNNVHQKKQKAWCRERSLDYQTLQNMTDYVTNHTSKSSTPGKDEPWDKHKLSKLTRVLFQAFPENICIYLGHKSMGYVRLKSNSSVMIDNLLHGDSVTAMFVLELVKDSKPTKYAKHFITVDDSVVRRNVFPGNLEQSLNGLLNKIVSETVIENVRPDVLQQFEHYGKRGDCQIAKVIDRVTKGVQTILDVDHEKKQIRIYSAKKLLGEIKQCVVKIIQKMMEHKEEYRQVVQYPTEESSTSVLIGPGLEVKHILMPGDIIDVLVIKQHYMFTKRKEQITEETVKKVFSKFGEIEFVKEFNEEERKKYGDYGRRKDTWGKVRFTDPKSVNKAVEGCADFEFRHPFYARSVPRHTKYKLKEGLVFTLKVCRRPYSGSVEIEYKKTEETPKTLPNFIDIDDEEIYIYPPYNKKHQNILNAAYVPKLDEEVFKKNLEEQVKIKVTKLTRLRMHPHPATPETYRGFKGLIDQAIGKKCKILEHSVTVFPVKEDDIDMEARLTIPYDSDVEAFRSDLGDVKYAAWFDEETVEIGSNVGISLFVPMDVWHATKASLQNVRQEILGRYDDAELKMEDSILQNGDHSIFIISESLERTKSIYKAFQKVIKPQVLSGLTEEDLRYLEGKDGKVYTGVNKRRFGVHMSVQTSKRELQIYGSTNSAKDALEAMKVLLGGQQEAHSMYTIDVNTYNIKVGTIKDHIEYLLEHRDTLSQIYGVSQLHVVSGNPVITLKGSPQSYVMMKRNIGSLLKKRFGSGATDAVDMCSACFCRPVAPLYRLSHCGHVYCMMCIKSHLSIAAEGKKFPIKCIYESCNEPVSWVDAKNILCYDEAILQDIIKAGVQLYTVRNPDIVKCCSTPDCHSIYGFAAETRPFWCQLCNATWCRHCHKPYHGGMPCIMEDLLADESIDPTVVEWIKENPENRKMCGKCKSGIEKIEGCNNIHCTNCMSSVCWLCLKYFDPDTSACYDHLSAVHGGISDGPDMFL